MVCCAGGDQSAHIIPYASRGFCDLFRPGRRAVGGGAPGYLQGCGASRHPPTHGPNDGTSLAAAGHLVAGRGVWMMSQCHSVFCGYLLCPIDERKEMKSILFI